MLNSLRGYPALACDAWLKSEPFGLEASGVFSNWLKYFRIAWPFDENGTKLGLLGLRQITFAVSPSHPINCSPVFGLRMMMGLPLPSLVLLKSPFTSAVVGTRDWRDDEGNNCSCQSCEKKKKQRSFRY